MKKTVKNNKSKSCPIENVSWLFHDIYTIHIIKTLLNKKKIRFTEFKFEIKDICDATLTKNLKTLEKEKIIEKETLKTFPPTTNYYLTKKGKDFSKVLKNIENYSKKYI
ncbi:MAG: helix-turn-helix domain-containing protein [Candidatus Nomurabacteria bacterium]